MVAGCLPDQRRGDILSGINADRGRRGRQRAHVGDEGARCGQRKMGADRIDAPPLLDEHQPVGVFDIDMAIMREAPRFGARPRAMPGAERDHAHAMLGGEDDVAGDEDHASLFRILGLLIIISIRKYGRAELLKNLIRTPRLRRRKSNLALFETGQRAGRFIS